MAALSGSSAVADFKAAFNKVFYAFAADGRVEWDLLVRRGALTQADATYLKGQYETYLATRGTRGAVLVDTNPLPIKDKFNRNGSL